MSPPLSTRVRSRLVRIAALGVALLAYYVALRWVTPAVARAVEPSFPARPGPHLFLQHLLTFSLPTALVCLATWFALARAGLLAAPRPWLGLGPQPRQAVRWGLIAGIAGSALVLAAGVAGGQHLHLHPSGWKIAGNVFSNYYEEVAYRGLLLQASWTATGSRVGAIVISSLVFGWSHGGGWHVTSRMIAACIAGLIFGYLAVRTRSLGGPWVAHQVSDMILDSL